MEKKKITAGSVDELLEIVRAVQKGEDPDIDKIREEQRRKREEQILERRRKKSGGSADSAGPVRASKGKRKGEKDREEEQEEGSAKPEKPETEDAQETETEEPETAADDFSWPQFDPRKILEERNEKQESAESDASGSDDGENTAEEADGQEKPEDKKRQGIFRRAWDNLKTDAEDEEEDEELENESDEDEFDEEGEESDEKPGRKDSRQDEDDFDDDEFEQALNEDNAEEEFIKSRETMAAFTSKAAGVFGDLLQKAGSAAAKGRERARRRAEEQDKFPEEISLDEKPRIKDVDSRQDRGVNRTPDSENDHLRNMERNLFERRRNGEEEPEDNFGYEKEPESQEKEEFLEGGGEKTQRKGSPESREQKRERKLPEDEEPEEDRNSPGNRERKQRENLPETDSGRGKEDEPVIRKISRKAPDRKQTRRRRGAGGSGKRGVPALPESVQNLLHAAGKRIREVWFSLNQRGIHKREMAMLGMVLLFILLILFFIVNAVQNFFSQKQKSKNVTAEDGLVVTVEDEPQKWTSSYPVQLKILCKKGSITAVTINGTACTPDENGMITLETSDWRLQARVETDSGAKTAEIEIPMLDGEAPVLDIKREKDTVVLSAADARSQVAGIYYAIEDPAKYRQLPLYQKYQEPIKYENGMTYRFFARDKAGNASIPVVSTLEDAESFTLGQTKMSLFPNETCSLSVEASPTGALLRNLKFESLDTSVVTVEEDGKVTAVGEGTAEVRVSADGMESQTCTFDVSTERSVLVSTVGDCTLGTDESFDASTSFNAFDAVHGHSYFFRNVKDILGSDDVTFANFEGTLTDSTEREAKQFAFKGDPSYTEILKDGSVEVVTLANNHSKDYGEQSLEDTKAALEEAGIDYCIGDEIVMREVNGVQIAFIGIYVLDIGLEVQTQVVQTITQARQQGADLVIVAFHWGSEKATTPDETQRSLAHTAVDRGADLVVGHHPHVLQGIEQYNGKYIVYSLANFCFGGNSSPSDMDTMIFQQNFTIGQDGTVKNGEISIIPCSISSESGYNNYQPTPVSGSEAERIIGRLNEYSEEFGQTYEAAER